MKALQIGMLFCLVAGVEQPAFAYEELTHMQLSATASLLSDLSVAPGKIARLGFKRPLTDEIQRFPNSERVKRPLIELLQDGANLEDAGTRSLNHFFDPRSGVALTLDAAQFPAAMYGAVLDLNSATLSSPDWALGTGRANGLNEYSYIAARRAWHLALTSSSTATRDANFGLVFEALGHLIHHVQDMAQPQHVRNDVHLSYGSLETNCVGQLDSWYAKACPAYLALRNPSLYEKWTAALPVASLPLLGYAPVYGATADGNSTFSEPRKFWTNSSKGMADYTNRNFLSTGTMDLAPPTLGPANAVLVSTVCATAVPACGNLDPSALVTFYPSFVDDAFRNNASGNHPYAAAESIFSADFQTLTGGPIVRTVNRATFDVDRSFLLSRAVGYSAGLINYFFRGDFEISPPKKGVYGVTDTSYAVCGAACGFSTIRLGLKNTTPGNEAVGAGVLWSVAKYHINECFRSDGSGDYGGPNFVGSACRSAGEYVSVSQAKSVKGVSSTSVDELAFDFVADPIPVDATDLTLQVVFRGRLGQEDDAVAVSTVDIVEPQFFAIGNISDYRYDDIHYDLPRWVPAAPQPPFSLSMPSVSFADPSVNGMTAVLPTLGPGQWGRIAFLAQAPTSDPNSLNFHAWISVAPAPYQDNFGAEDGEIPNDPFVFDETTSLYARTCPVTLQRGIFQQYFVYYGQGTHSGSGAVSAVASKRMGRQAKISLADCYDYSPPGTLDVRDFSMMTPLFTPAGSLPWQINF